MQNFVKLTWGNKAKSLGTPLDTGLAGDRKKFA
jgi:hypothetical protein